MRFAIWLIILGCVSYALFSLKKRHASSRQPHTLAKCRPNADRIRERLGKLVEDYQSKALSYAVYAGVVGRRLSYETEQTLKSQYGMEHSPPILLLAHAFEDIEDDYSKVEEVIAEYLASQGCEPDDKSVSQRLENFLRASAKKGAVRILAEYDDSESPT